MVSSSRSKPSARGEEGDPAGLDRAPAEGELQHPRQQERHRVEPDATEEASEHADAEGTDVEQAEIERRMRDKAGVASV